MNNIDVARILYNISVILEIQEGGFKPVAYRRAARYIESMSEDLNTIKDLESLPTIGEGIAKKIKEILSTGKSIYYEKLKKQMPINIEELMSIPGIGPKTIMKIYKKLKITNRKQLLQAARNRKIRKIEGLGPIVEKNIISNITFQKKSSKRRLLIEGIKASDDVINELKKSGFVDKISVAGSVRRMRETIGDIDIICTSKKPKELIEFFTDSIIIKKVLAEGSTKASVRLFNSLQVDLRVVKPEQYGSALHHFTGSKDHNINLRKYAIKKGIKINEYGLFKNNKRIAGSTEESVYKSLSMQFIPPELRENRGEIELAIKNKLPKLLIKSDLRGDLHIHSNWSDGVSSIKELAEYARNVLKYDYIGIADHANLNFMKNTLNKNTYMKRLKEINDLNSTFKKFKILNCIEANIKASGKLDMPDSFLSKFDLVIASTHYGFKGDQTKRIINAMKNEHVDIMGHISCRKLLSREGVDFDPVKVFSAGEKYGKVFEIDSFPNRMDLGDDLARLAKSYGCKFAIDTDAHQAFHLNYINIGVGIARRAGLIKSDVLNTRKLSEIYT